MPSIARILFVVLLVVVAMVVDFAALSEALIAQSMGTYLALKTANAVVSVFQESTLQANFVVGAQLAVGQILDPLNDLIEKSALVVFAGI